MVAIDTDLQGYKEAERLLRAGIDVVSGGYPCQGNSRVNVHQRPTDPAERVGLGRAMVRTLRLVGARFGIMENVAGQLDGGMGIILGDLAGIGFDAEWDCISAEDVGAPHERKRVIIVAYPCGQRPQGAIQAGNGEPPSQGVIAWSETARALMPTLSAHWKSGAGVSGMDDGIPLEVDRIEATGNAILPQVAQFIGAAIMKRLRTKGSEGL